MPCRREVREGASGARVAKEAQFEEAVGCGARLAVCVVLALEHRDGHAAAAAVPFALALHLVTKCGVADVTVAAGVRGGMQMERAGECKGE